MANDNQTALGMSIQRKKDRVRIIKHQKERSDKLDWQNTSLTLQGRIDELEFQIAEDEKMLAVEKEQWVDAYVTGAFHFCELELDDPTIRKEGNDNYTQKYGTDGK